jgi:hypothetical protein
MSKQADKKPAARKDTYIQVRLDPELASEFVVKASEYGGASVVVRALIRRWLENEKIISAQDALAEISRAPRRRSK